MNKLVVERAKKVIKKQLDLITTTNYTFFDGHKYNPFSFSRLLRPMPVPRYTFKYKKRFPELLMFQICQGNQDSFFALP